MFVLARHARRISTIAVWSAFILVMIPMTASCSNESPEDSVPSNTLKVTTHTNDTSGNEARIAGSLAVDGAGCVTLHDDGGDVLYPAFPRTFVETTSDSLVFDERSYRVGDEIVLAGGSADDAEGLSIPPGCPSHGLIFISAPR